MNEIELLLLLAILLLFLGRKTVMFLTLLGISILFAFILSEFKKPRNSGK